MNPRPSGKQHATDASVHLDAVRGLAALWVLFGHGPELFIRRSLGAMIAHKPGSDATNVAASFKVAATSESVFMRHLRYDHLFGGQEPLARVAVILFFVLSGYLVGGSVLRNMRNETFSWSQYLFLRLTRLWTVLIPALLLGAALDLCGMYLLHSQVNIYRASPVIAPSISSRLTLNAFFGTALFLQDIVTERFGTNGPLWSLSCEFWFYIFFPLILIAIWGSRPTRVRVASGLLLLLLMVLCGWQIAILFPIWLLGAGLALLPLRLPPRLRKKCTVLAGLLIPLTVYLELRLHAGVYLSDYILGVAFFILLWTLLHAQQVSVHPVYRTLAQRLSHMSYTLYLVHFPMLVFISALLMPVWKMWPVSPQSLLKLLLILVVVFAYAWLVYYCFERNTDRVRKWLRPFWVGRGAVTAESGKTG